MEAKERWMKGTTTSVRVTDKPNIRIRHIKHTHTINNNRKAGRLTHHNSSKRNEEAEENRMALDAFESFVGGKAFGAGAFGESPREEVSCRLRTCSRALDVIHMF